MTIRSSMFRTGLRVALKGANPPRTGSRLSWKSTVYFIDRRGGKEG